MTPPTGTSGGLVSARLPHSQPHVVMMVANDVRADTRVRKMAESLASTGIAVTVLGLDHVGDGYESTLGLAELIVPKVDKRFRSYRARLMRGRSKAYWLKSEIGLSRDAFQIEQRDAAARVEWIREDGQKRRASVGTRATGRKERTLDRYSAVRISLKQQARDGSRLVRSASKAGLRLTDSGYGAIRSLQRLRTTADFGATKTRARVRERSVRRHLVFRRAKANFRVRRLRRKLIRAQSQDGHQPRVRMRSGSWRRDLPEFDDYEATLGPLLDAIDADVFHAHDVHLLGVASRAAARARYRGIDTRVVYDAHEYVAGLARYSRQMVEAFTSIESEYIHHADRVITVSEPLADLIQQDHSLERRPDVVLNIPVPANPDDYVPSLYGNAGVPLDAEVLVYSGGMDEARNVHTIVRALPLLPANVYLVLVARSETNYIQSLFDLAEDLGVERRLRLAPFVGPNEVVDYLAEASVGVHAMISSKMNHQIALPNKLFEYLHAGLPMCVSDNKAMMDFVEETGVGEWFAAEDPQSLADAVIRVLADRDRYVRARYEDPDLLVRFTWEKQAERMVEVYQELLGDPDLRLDRLAVDDDGPVSSSATRSVSLAIGPLNQAGQANLWAHALAQNTPDVSTSVFMVVRPEKLRFPASHPVEIVDWWNPKWRQAHQALVLREFTHVLIESGSPILGGRRGVHFDVDLDALHSSHVATALAFHGSDIRNPGIHRELMPASPFHAGGALTDRLEGTTAKMLALVESFDGPVFVSTKDLFDYIPRAEWLPQVIDGTMWTPQPLRLGDRRVIVASTFTNRMLKGAEHADPIGKELAAEGLIEYRRYAYVPPAKMPGIIEDVDVLIDGIVLGLYGTTSVEGMATGRLVLANIDRVIDKPGEFPPIVNVNPSTLRDVLVDITDRPEHYREIAARGPEFVRRYHDGRYSARQLAGFLGVDAPKDMSSDEATGVGNPL